MNRPVLILFLFIVLLSVTAFGFLRQSKYSAVTGENDVTDFVTITDIPYESLFRQLAPEIGWQWEMLAAVCWEESHWNPDAQSVTGARGLMQLMPKTGRRFGLTDSTFCLPEDNLRAGTEYIKHLQRTFSFITDSAENQHFVLASYNAGPAHIMDARRLAKRHGRSPYIWFGNTEYWLEQLQYEDVAADSVVLYGTFNPAETLSYVRKVKRTYKRLVERRM